MTDARYEPVLGWGDALPDMRGRDVTDVTVGPDDEVYLLYRDPSFVVVSGPDGDLRRTIGLGQREFAALLSIPLETFRPWDSGRRIVSAAGSS